MPESHGITSQSASLTDNVCYPDFPSLTMPVTIVSGAGVLVRNTILGKITIGGKYKKSLSAETDGSQTPAAILHRDVDATFADVEADAWFTGAFNQNGLTYGTAHTAASVFEGLRGKGIYLKDSSIV